MTHPRTPRLVVELLPQLTPEERQEVRQHLAGLDQDDWLDASALTSAEKALIDRLRNRRLGARRRLPRSFPYRIVDRFADDLVTVVAEVRPALGEYVSVAELRLRRDSEILDLATKPDPPNPFVGESPRYAVEFEQLLWAFAQQLAKPLRSRDDVSDYIPTQKLADAIEKAGLAGIRYPSAMAPGGTNAVMLRHDARPCATLNGHFCKTA